MSTVADLAERLDVIEAQREGTEAALLGIANRLSETVSDLEKLKGDVGKDRVARRRSPKAQ